MSSIVQGFPVPTAPIVSPQGNLTPVWYQFMYNLWNRTGGASSNALVLAGSPTGTGQIPIFNGSAWNSVGISGDASLNASGALTVTKSSGNAFAAMAFQAANAVAISGGNINGTAIGTITPSTGVFVGVNTNSDAAAGQIGEYISSTISSGAPVTLSNATPANITSISLTAGDWDVWGEVSFTPAGTTTATAYSCGVSTTSATLPTAPAGGAIFTLQGLSFSAGQAQNFPCGKTCIKLAVTTTVYLVAQATFAVSTLTAYGFIGARRPR